MTEHRMPPQNLHAEKSVLGSQIIEQRTIDSVREILSPSEFYSDVHGKIQKALIKLRDGGSNVDAVTLAAQLEATGDLEDVGGIPYLMELMEAVPHSGNAAHYATLIVDCSKRRIAIAISQKLIEKSYDMAADRTEQTESAVSTIEKLTENAGDGSRFLVMADEVAKMIDGMDAGVMPAVSILIPEFDEMTQGTAPGEMIVMAARPSHGKTLCGLQCVDKASLHGYPCLIISEEMSAALLASRSLSSLTVMPSTEWLRDTNRLRYDAREHFAKRAPILIAEKCTTSTKAERAIAQAVRRHGVGVVIVDYAQLLKGDGTTEYERITDVSQRMKAAASKYNVRLILMSQMNRSIETRENPVPELSDLRGSGSLEQDADIILMFFFPHEFDKEYPDPYEYRVYDRKGRNRPATRSVMKMRINKERQRLEHWEGGNSDHTSAADNF